MRYLFVVLLSGSLVLSLGWAQNQQLETKEVFVFPGDLAFVYKSGFLNFNNRKAVLDETPEALYGTFWVRPGGNFGIARTEFGIDTLYRPVEVKNFFEVLLANVGKTAKVTYEIGQEVEDVRGEVLPFNQGTELARIRQPNGQTIFLERQQIRQVAIEGEASMTYLQPYEGAATIVELDVDRKTAPIEMYYYRRGLSWEPTYALKLGADTLVQLNMKASLRNDGESLNRTRMKFVLAPTNLRYGNENLNPMAQELLQLLGNPEARKPLGKPDSIWEAEKPASNLFYFSAENVSIRKGSKADIPVLSKQIPATNAVRVRIPLQIDTTTLVPALPQKHRHLAERTLRIRNTTDGPLPPGSVFVTDRDNRPMGQDKLPAMKPDEVATISFGSASEVYATISERVESEVKRAKREGGVYYDYVEVAGIVTVETSASSPRAVAVEVRVPGEVKRSSLAISEALGTGPLGVKITALHWQLEVQPDRPATYNYKYGLYIPK